jgi:hypothetical protein
MSHDHLAANAGEVLLLGMGQAALESGLQVEADIGVATEFDGLFGRRAVEGETYQFQTGLVAVEGKILHIKGLTRLTEHTLVAEIEVLDSTFAGMGATQASHLTEMETLKVEGRGAPLGFQEFFEVLVEHSSQRPSGACRLLHQVVSQVIENRLG